MTSDVSGLRYSDTLRAMDRAHELAASFIRELPHRHVSRIVSPAEMSAALDEALPDTSSDPIEAISEWMERAEPGIVADPGPRFFGFVNGGVTPAALAGDWLTSTPASGCSVRLRRRPRSW